ncbi:MAG: hypothetical protein GY934_05060, partial [Gammaproteobacteria bacterium]|nr:hypothetical protein [Gammaproteobacteria bacterium]
MIFEYDAFGKADTPSIPWESPEDFVQFGGNVCGRGPAFFRADGQMTEIPSDKQRTDASDQGDGSGGGVYSGSVLFGRTGAQQADGFLGMAPPDNGVNYCDIDFGFCEDLPAVSSLFGLPDNGVSGGCSAGLPVTLRGAPLVPGPGRMESFDWTGMDSVRPENCGTRILWNGSATGMDS